MVDVGANIGDSALQVLAKVDARVLCVEGDTYWLDYLHRNVDGDPRIRVVPALVLPEASDQLAAVRRNGTTHFVEGGDGQDSAAGLAPRELRERAAGLGRVRLVKSDTDGYDVRIVPAMAAAWQDEHPVLFFEYDPALTRAVGDDAPDPGVVGARRARLRPRRRLGQLRQRARHHAAGRRGRSGPACSTSTSPSAATTTGTSPSSTATTSRCALRSTRSWVAARSAPGTREARDAMSDALAEEQSDAHHRRRRDLGLRRAGATGAVVRLLSVLIALVTVRISVDALGTVQFGVAATLATITALRRVRRPRHRTGTADQAGDRARPRRRRRDARARLVRLDDVARSRRAVAVIGARPHRRAAVDDAARVLPRSARPRSTSRCSSSSSCTALAIPAAIGQRVQIGLQRGAQVSVWMLGTSVAMLAAVAAARRDRRAAVGVRARDRRCTRSSSRSRRRCSCSGAPTCTCDPSRRFVTRAKVRELLGVSGLFLALSIAVAVSYQTDALVVSAVLGASSAAVFAVTLRMFTTLTGLFGGLTQQMWPALAEALARR